jgi:hypothetical protein
MFHQNHTTGVDGKTMNDGGCHVADARPNGHFFYNRFFVSGKVRHDGNNGLELRDIARPVLGKIEQTQTASTGGEVEFPAISIPVQNVVEYLQRPLLSSEMFIIENGPDGIKDENRWTARGKKRKKIYSPPASLKIAEDAEFLFPAERAGNKKM